MDSTGETEGPVGPVYIIGCGKVGSALALRLVEDGVELVGGHCLHKPSAERASTLIARRITSGPVPPEGELEAAEIVIIAVPDPSIPLVAEQLAQAGRGRKGQVALHCSGARSAQELAPLRDRMSGVASFHPLLSFADPVISSRLLGRATFAVEGDDLAVQTAERLVGFIGAKTLRVAAEDRVIYHAAAAIASNHLVALTAQAVALLGVLGVQREAATAALLPLMSSTLENLAKIGLPAALTGPVSRGDAACVGGHTIALGWRAREELEAYVVMARRALVVAREQGVATARALDKVDLELEQALARGGQEGSGKTT